MTTGKKYMGGAGASNTSALAYGGNTGATPAISALTESWNGSNWTETTDLNAARRFVALGNGIQTAALCIGGDQDPPRVALVEQWNGSNWTEVGD